MCKVKSKSRNPEQALGFIPIEKSERICEKKTSGEFYISGAINEADRLLVRGGPPGAGRKFAPTSNRDSGCIRTRIGT